MPVSKRINLDDVNGRTETLPFEEVNKSKTYWQVRVGSYGVTLPNNLNMDTLNGLTLVEGKASSLHNKELAGKIAKKTAGKLLEVTETFTREVKEI